MKALDLEGSNACTDTLSYAFFDVDDTLIRVKSMLSFQAYWYDLYPDEDEHLRYLQDIEQRVHGSSSWEELNRRYYRYFAGRRVAEVEAAGRAWLVGQLQRRDFFCAAALAELRQHQRAGRQVVLVSGSFPALLVPLAERLQVTHLLATRMAVADGVFTGDILPPQTIGTGKATAINALVAREGGSLAHSYAYGDDISDLPMLELVGNPRVIAGGRALEGCARDRGWPVLAAE